MNGTFRPHDACLNLREPYTQRRVTRRGPVPPEQVDAVCPARTSTVPTMGLSAGPAGSTDESAITVRVEGDRQDILRRTMDAAIKVAAGRRPMLGRRFQAAAFARQVARDPSLGMPTTYEMSSVGLRTQAADGEQLRPWSQFSHVFENRGDLALVLHGGALVAVLPHFAFADDGHKALVQQWIAHWIAHVPASSSEPVGEADPPPGGGFVLAWEERRAEHLRRMGDAALEVLPLLRRPHVLYTLLGLMFALGAVALFSIGVTWVVFAALAIVFGLILGRRRVAAHLMVRAFRRDPLIGTGATYVLTPAGLQFRCQGYESTQSWSPYASVREHDGSLLLVRHGNVVFVLLPPWAFTDDDHRHQVAAAVDTWITQAVRPQPMAM